MIDIDRQTCRIGIRRRRVLFLVVHQDPPTHFNFARDVVEQWARKRPDGLALWWVREGAAREEKFTFDEVAKDLRRAASFFHQLGIRRGDRVLLILPRVPQWWIAI